MTKANFSYSAEREIRTYAYLYAAARDALDKAKTIEEGNFYQTMSSLVFSAFALEAYLNHVGESKIKFWREIETINPLSKLKVLYVSFGLDFNSSKRPIQTIKQIFKFRNFMAHGRTENVKDTGTRKTPRRNPGEKLVESDWEKFCNQKEAERAIKDVKEIAEKLSEAAGFEKYPFDTLSSGSYIIGKTES